MLEVRFPISIVYGETDWMDTRGSAKIIENSKFFRDGWSNLYLLKDAGHQMAWDNPVGLAEILVKDTLGENRKIFQPGAPTIRYLNGQAKDLKEHDWD